MTCFDNASAPRRFRFHTARLGFTQKTLKRLEGRRCPPSSALLVVAQQFQFNGLLMSSCHPSSSEHGSYSEPRRDSGVVGCCVFAHSSQLQGPWLVAGMSQSSCVGRRRRCGAAWLRADIERAPGSSCSSPGSGCSAGRQH